MGIDIYKPAWRLRQFIRYYWVLDTEAKIDTLTFPIGCPQLIFHRRGRFYIPELESYQARFSISGQVNFPARILSEGDAETIVVVFYPHALASVFNIPVSSFYNQEIDGYSLGDYSLNILADDIFNTDNARQAIGLIERWMLSRLRESSKLNFDRVGAALRLLLNDETISVEDMARSACLSRKQFDRVFFNTVGMKPKEYSTVVRFQRSLRLMQNGSRDYADIAYSCGYADQSHFIRECRRYAGVTPAELVKLQQPYSDLFTSYI